MKTIYNGIGSVSIRSTFNKIVIYTINPSQDVGSYERGTERVSELQFIVRDTDKTKRILEDLINLYNSEGELFREIEFYEGWRLDFQDYQSESVKAYIDNMKNCTGVHDMHVTVV